MLSGSKHLCCEGKYILARERCFSFAQQDVLAVRPYCTPDRRIIPHLAGTETVALRAGRSTPLFKAL